MELEVEPADLPYLPRPLSLVHAITVATMRATRIIPYAYQVRCAEVLYQGCDVFCIAGTGCGKTLSFVMLCFLCPKTMVWIISPLNYIESQQCEQFRAWGLCTINVNALTFTPHLVKVCFPCIHNPCIYHVGRESRLAIFT
jgi:hypothetical protein